MKNKIISESYEQKINKITNKVVPLFMEKKRNMYYHERIIDRLLDFCQSTSNDLVYIESKLVEYINEELCFFGLADLMGYSTYCRNLYSLFDATDKELFSEVYLVTLTMQLFLVEMNSTKRFKNNDIMCNIEKFIDMLQALLIYKIFCQNKSDHFFNKDIKSMMLETNYSEEEEIFFAEYGKMPDYTKPEEDYDISEPLRKFLTAKRLNLGGNLKSLNYIFKETLGFNFNELSILQNIIARHKQFQYSQIIHIHQSEMDHILKSYGLLSGNEIIDYFTINSLKGIQDISIRNIEFKAIYRTNDILIFGQSLFLETMNMLELTSVTNNFKDYIFIQPVHKGKLQALDVNLDKLFSERQNNLSNFFSYKVGDLLSKEGYLLPQDPKNNVILVDIKKFETKNHKIVVFNDIDVLALDTRFMIIYNIELKFYNPAVSEKDLKFDKIENKVYANTLKRHKILKEHLKDVLDSLFNIENNYDQYKIKSLIITARPNKGGLNKKFVQDERGGDFDMSYYTYNQFLDIIKNKEKL
ncbi:hypothetical protein ACWA2B_08470 [Paenibacillus sp. CMM36]